MEWKRLKQPRDPEDFEAVESIWGVQLPTDYKACAATKQGARPEFCAVDIPRRGTTQLQLLLYIDGAGEAASTYSADETWRRIRAHIPHGLFPFGDETGGNFFCFRYTKPDSDPDIVFWDPHGFADDDPEDAIYPICKTFTEFLGLLKEG